MARFRVLPAGRDSINDLGEELVCGFVKLAEDFIDPIETVEFLGPLLKDPQSFLCWERPLCVRHAFFVSFLPVV